VRRALCLVLLLGCTLGTEPTTESPVFSTAIGPALLLGAGDIARCAAGTTTPSAYNQANRTSDLLLARPGIPIFTVGDNEDAGDYQSFLNCYQPNWGRVKDRTLFPVPGNHDYLIPNASGYFVPGVGRIGRGTTVGPGSTGSTASCPRQDEPRWSSGSKLTSRRIRAIASLP
jgi:hypothetical protein